jgi:hypothetical protein
MHQTTVIEKEHNILDTRGQCFGSQGTVFWIPGGYWNGHQCPIRNHQHPSSLTILNLSPPRSKWWAECQPNSPPEDLRWRAQFKGCPQYPTSGQFVAGMMGLKDKTYFYKAIFLSRLKIISWSNEQGGLPRKTEKYQHRFREGFLYNLILIWDTVPVTLVPNSRQSTSKEVDQKNVRKCSIQERRQVIKL